MGQANKNKNIPKSNSSNFSKNVSTKCDYFGVTKYIHLNSFNTYLLELLVLLYKL